VRRCSNIDNTDAPALLSDATGLAALQAVLPANASVFCSPARRTFETALALGLANVALQRRDA